MASLFRLGRHGQLFWEHVMHPFENAAVAKVFENYPPVMRRKLMALRKLILDTAASTDGVGAIEETLKWGEPAYVTTQTKSGSAVRIDWKPSSPSQYAMYFHCKTTLVETFRHLFPHDFRFEGNRAIVFEASDAVPTDALAFCIAMSLTYHLAKRGPMSDAGSCKPLRSRNRAMAC
ncbi:MAG: DUF1801 domain-containing protein [Aquabacterium sp.]